ncbi:TIGR02444 family protein [Rhodococcus sp. IEGM1300]
MSSDLWSFSITTYALPDVERACLQLQSAGINVCLLLCGMWLEKQGVAFSAHRLQQLGSLAEAWDADVVQPLRTLRTRWKTVAQEDQALNALREKVKSLELEAERHLLLRLERLAQSWPRDEANDLSTWLEGIAAGAANLDRDALHQLRVAITNA